jgi:hypothetical protein
VRSYTGQQFTSTEDETIRLRVVNGVVRLPQRPVTAVASVEDVDGNAVEHTWHGGDRLELTVGVPDSWAFEVRRHGLEYVDVTYSHGGEVPEDVLAVVCQIASRAIGQPADQTGYASENIGIYGYTIGGAAAAGPLGTLTGERAVLDRYRRSAGVVWSR